MEGEGTHSPGVLNSKDLVIAIEVTVAVVQFTICRMILLTCAYRSGRVKLIMTLFRHLKTRKTGWASRDSTVAHSRMRTKDYLQHLCINPIWSIRFINYLPVVHLGLNKHLNIEIVFRLGCNVSATYSFQECPKNWTLLDTKDSFLLLKACQRLCWWLSEGPQGTGQQTPFPLLRTMNF